MQVHPPHATQDDTYSSRQPDTPEPHLESVDEVAHGADGSGLVGADGAPAFGAGRGPGVLEPRLETQQAEGVPARRQHRVLEHGATDAAQQVGVDGRDESRDTVPHGGAHFRSRDPDPRDYAPVSGVVCVVGKDDVHVRRDILCSYDSPRRVFHDVRGLLIRHTTATFDKLADDTFSSRALGNVGNVPRERRSACDPADSEKRDATDDQTGIACVSSADRALFAGATGRSSVRQSARSSPGTRRRQKARHD